MRQVSTVNAIAIYTLLLGGTGFCFAGVVGYSVAWGIGTFMLFLAAVWKMLEGKVIE